MSAPKQPVEVFKMAPARPQFGPGQNQPTTSFAETVIKSAQGNRYLPPTQRLTRPEQAPFFPQTKIPFFQRQRTRNVLLVLPMLAFCGGVGYYAFTAVRRDDFTKDPHYSEVLSELKREEIMTATRHLDRRGNAPNY